MEQKPLTFSEIIERLKEQRENSPFFKKFQELQEKMKTRQKKD